MARRVLLVEDSAQMTEAISRILAVECELIGTVSDGNNVLAEARRLSPTVIVLDISLPNISGMVLLPQLRSLLPNAVIVMLTTHSEELYIKAAFERGADAYVLKSDANERLLPAIRRGRDQEQRAHQHSALMPTPCCT